MNLRPEEISSIIKSQIKNYENKIGKRLVSEVVCRYNQYMSIKEKDAIHIACAIYASCDYMLSTDSRLLKYRTDKIILMNPVDFVYEMEDDSGEGTNYDE